MFIYIKNFLLFLVTLGTFKNTVHFKDYVTNLQTLIIFLLYFQFKQNPILDEILKIRARNKFYKGKIFARLFCKN